LYPPEYGVAHADELFMLFKARVFPLETVYTDEDKATSQNMLKLWTNFAKTGNPTPDLELGVAWDKYDEIWFT
jgi:carboxylesterase type B